jgi:hypothetical protein
LSKKRRDLYKRNMIISTLVFGGDDDDVLVGVAIEVSVT